MARKSKLRRAGRAGFSKPLLIDPFPPIQLRLIDAASLEGFFKSLIRRVGRYPAFSVEGRRYAGSDFSRVDGLIADCLAGRKA